MQIRKITDRLVSLVDDKLSPREVVVGMVLLTLSLAGLIFTVKTLILPKISTERIRHIGSINEGFIGNVKTINPFAPQTQNEKDLSKLLFSGLTHQEDAPNGYVLDLAQTITPSADNLSYTVTIAQNAKFQDGSQITTDDVLFSFEGLSKNKPSFAQITANKIDSRNIYFKLEKPNPSFLQELDFPIVKKGMTSILQEGFVGSGPYQISKMSTDNQGLISKIEMKAFDGEVSRRPYIQKYVLSFYPTEEALSTAIKNKELDIATGIRNNLIANSLASGYGIATSSMSGTFVLFVNQTKDNGLELQPLRHYLSQSINRTDLTNQVFGGYSTPFETITDIQKGTVTAEDLQKDYLTMQDGILYRKETVESENNKKTSTSTPIKFTLSTLDTPELLATAEIIKNQLKAAGVTVNVKVLSKEDLSGILQSKDYDLFLFGFYVPSPDTYYNFFHSSQTTYPKLNISGYANKKVDSVLETIRTNIQENHPVTQDTLDSLSQNLYKDMPVIFLYKSEFAMLYRKNISIRLPQNIQTIDDRYQFVTDWYTTTERVFPWFRNSQLIKLLEINF